jgi:hypothetical protein
MATCVYDNPETMSRECWQNGKIICSYKMELFFIDPFPVPAEHFFFGANIGPWKEGQLVGAKEAKEPTP